MRRMIDRAFDGITNTRIMTPETVNVFTFPHLVDVYKPVALVVGADKEAQDLNYVKLYTGQRCLLGATPDTEQPEMQGRTKASNIFTNDKFFFPAGVLIEDTYVFHMASSAQRLPDYVGLWWVAQSDAQAEEGYPFQFVAVQMVYAKLSPKPANLVV